MMRRTSTVIFTALAFFALTSIAAANVSTLKAGDTSVCEDASWIIYNVSESQETNVQFDIGPHAYGWGKWYKRDLPPGGYQTNAIAVRTDFKNNGPGDIQINCQRQRFDRNDWKIDAGSGKTYQSDYHMDHVRPGTYIEPGLGLPEGTERGIFSNQNQKPEYQR